MTRLLLERGKSAEADLAVERSKLAKADVTLIRNGHLVSALALLFLLPSFFFASYLSLAPRLVLFAGIVGTTILSTRRTSLAESALLAAPVAWARLGLCGGIALLLLVLGGEDHLVFANWDWLWRDAVLADVVRARSLPTYHVEGETYWLRAPLGMYLLPAAVGRVTSLAGAHLALLLQNVVLLAGMLYLLVSLATKRGFLHLPIFIAFGGLDILSTMVFRVLSGKPAAPFSMPSMIEGSIGALQYTGNVTQLFWVPNHTLPGWWLALLILLRARREIGLGEVGLGLAAATLWSPLAVAGAMPFVVVLLLSQVWCTIRDIRFWASALAALCFLPVAIYLVADAGSVPHKLLITMPDFWIVIVLFLVFKIPHGFVLGLTSRRLPPDLGLAVLVAIVVLVLLPTVQFGVNNDLVMRGSIPALAIVSFAFCEIVTQGARPQPIVFAMALAIIIVSAASPMFEIIRAIRFPRFAISDCNLVTVWKSQLPDIWLANYLAKTDRVPGWLLTPSPEPSLPAETRACWPDHPFDPKMAVWVRTNAELDASMRARAQLNSSK